MRNGFHQLAVLTSMALATACAAPAEEHATLPIPEPIPEPESSLCDGSYLAAVSLPLIGEDALLEVSGLVASRINPRILWVHNDSGDSSRVYAIREDGTALGRLYTAGVVLVDVEDIASGPCPNGTSPCLWLADTGNNGLNRSDQAIVVVPEPTVDDQPFGVVNATQIWLYPIAFPDRPVDSEAMVVSLDGSTVYLFDKTDSARSTLYAYRAPFEAGRVVTLETVGTLETPVSSIPGGQMITGADLHPTGERLAVRTYSSVVEYRSASDPMENPEDTQQILVPSDPTAEPQGEAIAYSASGQDLWTMSESVNGSSVPPLHHYLCDDAP